MSPMFTVCHEERSRILDRRAGAAGAAHPAPVASIVEPARRAEADRKSRLFSIMPL